MRGIKSRMFERMKMAGKPGSRFLRDHPVPASLKIKARYVEPFVRKWIAGRDQARPVLQASGINMREAPDQQSFQFFIGKSTKKKMLKQGNGELADEQFHSRYERKATDQRTMKRWSESGAEYSALDLPRPQVKKFETNETGE